MPYNCHKCAATIEGGTPFCPHCGAPQIRVAMPAESSAIDSPAFVPGTPAEMQPPAEPVPLSALSFPPQPGAFSLRSALPSALIAGIAIGIACMIPIGSAAQFAWMVLVVGIGGALSVVIYKRRHPAALPIRPLEGCKVGALSSLFGYLLFSLVIVTAFVTNGSAVRQELVKRVQEIKPPDPAMQDAYQQLAQKLATPEGMATIVTLALAFFFFFFLIVGAAGGAIGATLSHRERRD